MLLLQKLNKLFVILFLLVSASVYASETKWEVAIVFRGEAEDEQFQKDIDENILELARITPTDSLKIGIYREMEGRSYTYLPSGTAKKEINFGEILYRQDLNQILLPGKLKKNSSANLDGFLKSFYKDKTSKKALIIYSHGKGSLGLSQLSTSDLKDTLSAIPHLDLLWFDACFMANMEFLYEMRAFSEYIISSEEAEFSSGLPFQTLTMLPGFQSAKEAAISLSKNFIESYSYIKNGSQRNYVSISSATISVVESNKLETLARSLKMVSSVFKNLSEGQKNILNSTLHSKATMDEKSMIDLGILLIEMRKITSSPLTAVKLTALIRLLNIEAVKKLKTNPRIHIFNPGIESRLVYGFNNWQDGVISDVKENTVFDSIIKHDGFISGPNQNEWPYKLTKSRHMSLTPFAPGINVFNYYFLNSKNNKLLSKALSVARTHDVVESYADSEATPLAYTAYTQQVGFKAERYTGLNITFPGSVPSLDYFEMEFNQLADWLSL
jgi:hypothetical protein